MLTPSKRASAGQRDRSITIQQRQVADVAGSSRFTVETWTDLVTLWASRDDMSGDETFTRDQKSASLRTRWWIPYHRDLDPEVLNVPKLRRVVHQTRVYDIVAAELIGRRDGILLFTLASTKAAA